MRRKLGSQAVRYLVIGPLIVGAACNTDKALFLNDWGRDVLLGSGALAAAFAVAGIQATQTAIDAAQAEQSTPPAQGAPGEQGSQGERGVPGSQGSPGEQGPQGAAGSPGQPGEQGAQGPAGSQGERGDPGAPGPEFFSTFVDEFFVEDDGEYRSTRSAPAFDAPVGWKVAIPNRYNAGNPVTMRLFLHRVLEDFPQGDCEVFRLATIRLRNGSPIEELGELFLQVELPIGDGAGDGEEPPDDIFIVVDLPINTEDGLNLTSGDDDLAPAQFLSFGMEWGVLDNCDGALYSILGVEFFESPVGEAALFGARVSEGCPGDCDCRAIGEPPCGD
jgi:hypothetical protein